MFQECELADFIDEMLPIQFTEAFSTEDDVIELIIHACGEGILNNRFIAFT